MENYVPPEVGADFFLLYRDNCSFLEGWICLDDKLESLRHLFHEEIEFAWGSEYSDMNNYRIYHIDVEDKNYLKEINDQHYYQEVRGKDRIFLVILHKLIEYRYIENIPLVFEWFQKHFPTI